MWQMFVSLMCLLACQTFSKCTFDPSPSSSLPTLSFSSPSSPPLFPNGSPLTVVVISQVHVIHQQLQQRHQSLFEGKEKEREISAIRHSKFFSYFSLCFGYNEKNSDKMMCHANSLLSHTEMPCRSPNPKQGSCKFPYWASAKNSKISIAVAGAQFTPLFYLLSAVMIVLTVTIFVTVFVAVSVTAAVCIVWYGCHCHRCDCVRMQSELLTIPNWMDSLTGLGEKHTSRASRYDSSLCTSTLFSPLSRSHPLLCGLPFLLLLSSTLSHCITQITRH